MNTEASHDSESELNYSENESLSNTVQLSSVINGTVINGLHQAICGAACALIGSPAWLPTTFVAP